MLAAVGLLKRRRPTTHWAGVDRLAEFGATACTQRVVIDGYSAKGRPACAASPFAPA